jgi:hypothetical protein
MVMHVMVLVAEPEFAALSAFCIPQVPARTRSILLCLGYISTPTGILRALLPHSFN